jgi:hypothetical protein
MNIDRKDWQKASGGLVEDDHGNLWRIAGFIDSPAVVLNPLNDECRHQKTIIMGSALSNEYHWLRREPSEA